MHILRNPRPPSIHILISTESLSALWRSRRMMSIRSGILLHITELCAKFLLAVVSLLSLLYTTLLTSRYLSKRWLCSTSFSLNPGSTDFRDPDTILISCARVLACVLLSCKSCCMPLRSSVVNNFF